LRVHPWTSAAVAAQAGGWGSSACFAWLAVGEGQRRSRAHPWMSAAVTAPAKGGERHLLCSAYLLASGLARQRIGLPCMLAAQGGGEGGAGALADGSPGITAL
jgi:hypothetical protein